MSQFQYYHYESNEYMSVDPHYDHNNNQAFTYAQPLRNQLDLRHERYSLDLIPGNLSLLESSAYTPSAIQTGYLPNLWTETAIMTNSGFWPQLSQSPPQNYQFGGSTMVDVSIRYSSPNVDAPFPDTVPHHFSNFCDPCLLEGGEMDIKVHEPSEYHYGLQDSQVTSRPEFSHGLMDANSFRGVDVPRLKLDQSSTEDNILPISPSPVDYNYRSLTFRRLSNEGQRDMSSFDKPVAPEAPGEEPYAKLICKALQSRDSRAMVLKEIYEWFKINTNKTDTNTKGWQNSIRHNLSMNGAFVKREATKCGGGTKRHCEWYLSPIAERDGIKSTTRYRNKTNDKRIAKHDSPSEKRQISGGLGGHYSALQLHPRKQQKIKTEPFGRLEPRPYGEDLAPDFDSSTHGISPYPKQRSQSPQNIKIEGADTGRAPYYKQDLPAFGNVKGIFEDPSLYDLPPFVNDAVSYSSPIPEVKNDYQYL